MMEKKKILKKIKYLLKKMRKIKIQKMKKRREKKKKRMMKKIMKKKKKKKMKTI